jgi:hypothetical protein
MPSSEDDNGNHKRIKANKASEEVYVPLIAILLVIPAGSYKQRIQAMVPFIAVGIGYALWRHKVLGSWIGGYLMNPVEPNILTILTIVQQLVNK